eukprot:scpid55108/ scgid7198/ 
MSVCVATHRCLAFLFCTADVHDDVCVDSEYVREYWNVCVTAIFGRICQCTRSVLLSLAPCGVVIQVLTATCLWAVCMPVDTRKISSPCCLLLNGGNKSRLLSLPAITVCYYHDFKLLLLADITARCLLLL